MHRGRGLAERTRTTAAVALEEIRARPLHAALGALVAGLLAGPRAPIVVLLGLLASPLVARRPVGALAVATCPRRPASAVRSSA